MLPVQLDGWQYSVPEGLHAVRLARLGARRRRRAGTSVLSGVSLEAVTVPVGCRQVSEPRADVRRPEQLTAESVKQVKQAQPKPARLIHEGN